MTDRPSLASSSDSSAATVASGSHARCLHGHICQQPSGRACAEQPCDQPAGTWWGPYWCPEHDKERLDRVTKSLETVLADHRAAVEKSRQASIDLMAKTCGHPASDLLVIDNLHYCGGCARQGASNA